MFYKHIQAFVSIDNDIVNSYHLNNKIQLIVNKNSTVICIWRATIFMFIIRRYT